MLKGNFEREFIVPASLDQMMDQRGGEFLTGDHSPEDHFIEEVDKREGCEHITAMFNKLLEISPKHALAAALMAQGIHGERFAEEMQLGHDAANTVRKQVLDLAPKGIGSIDLSRLKAKRTGKEEYYRQRTMEIVKNLF